jgi:TatD DNase family protein
VCDDRPERGGAELAGLLKLIPEDRLLIETDAPYLVPRSIKPSKARPGRNEPALLPHVLNAVAAAVGRDPVQVAEQTTANAKRVFGIDFTTQ